MEHLPQAQPRAVNAAIFAGCVVAFLSFGFAASFGVFLSPMSTDLGWSREVFSLSVAIQALVWGVTQPIAGLMADRHGSARVVAFGAILAALGFLLRGTVILPDVFIWSGVIVGIGTGACSFPVVVVALGKVVPDERRSFIMGLGTASASLGMFVAAPLSIYLINSNGWQPGLLFISLSFLAILPFLLLIARVSVPTAPAGSKGESSAAISEAFHDRSYLCLFIGFFVCGFHVSFIQTHLPAYVIDMGLAAKVGGWSIALIGLFNIAGSFLSGWAGQRFSKRNSLVLIYLARALVIAVFLMIPISAASVYAFSAAMGLLWLSTVPLTMGLVAATQGLKYLSTLVGLVFFSHQVGAFIGAWLGGRIYDVAGNYTPMWISAVLLGVLAALVHLPVRETRAPQTA